MLMCLDEPVVLSNVHRNALFITIMCVGVLQFKCYSFFFQIGVRAFAHREELTGSACVFASGSLRCGK